MFVYGAPAGTRSPNLLIRSPMVKIMIDYYSLLSFTIIYSIINLL